MLSKLKNSLFVIIILLYTGASVSAQKTNPDDPVLLHGVVMDASSLQALPNVHYIVNSGYGGVSGTDGKFSMFLERMDTVVFSYLGYQNVTFILSDTLRVKSS